MKLTPDQLRVLTQACVSHEDALYGERKHAKAAGEFERLEEIDEDLNTLSTLSRELHELLKVAEREVSAVRYLHA